MPTWFIALTLAALQPQATGAGRAGIAANTCVTCHERLPASTAAGHSFVDWRQSPHGRVGATCDKCHGGDPTRADQPGAHRGVFSSRESQSTVYYTRIPATCGSCHSREFGFFNKSRHYTQLVTTGRGPNCVTCHGSMATRVLAPREMEATCSACHNPERRQPSTAPIAARYLLVLLQQVDFGIGVTDRLAGRSDRAAQQAAGRYLQQARESMQLARQAWHSFDLNQIEDMLVRTGAAARQADSVLGGRTKR